MRIVTSSRLIVFYLALGFFQPALAQEIDFATQIRPILSDRCYFCHGPDEQRREADLRLDDFEAATEYAIVPGDPDDSEVIARILSEDPDLLMPPPSSKLELSPEEKQLLKQWISEGAEYAEHWAFEAIRRPDLPNADDSAEHPIDQLVGKQLAQRGLSFSERADRATLIRRLSLDLTGLPPTIEEIEAFENDMSEDAFEQLVDRLLNSPRYGERMAVDWLDVARYADTYGYQNDRYRPMWPWRDWVVDAFNNNLPYDDFIRWQLAGDLQPEATREQILATGFNRNHRQTNEGGSVEEEFRAEYVADRVNTFGAAFLGLTLECCRCHDHKYDPFSQRDYYQLAAFFNSIDEAGLYSHFTEATPTPTLLLADDEQDKKLQAAADAARNAEQTLLAWQFPEKEFASWRGSLSDVRQLPGKAVGTHPLRDMLHASLASKMVGHFDFEVIDDNKVKNLVTDEAEGKLSDNPESVDGRLGKGLKLSGDNNVEMDAGGTFSRNQPFTISLWIKPDKKYDRAVIFHRSRAWTDSASRGYELLIEDGRLSGALIHFWPGNALRVVAKDELPVSRWSHITFAYDGSSRAAGLQLFVDGEPLETETIRDSLTKHIKGSDGFGGGDSTKLAIGQRFRDMGFKYGLVDEVKVFNDRLTHLEINANYVLDAFPDNLPEVIYNVAKEPLREYFRSQDKDYQALAARLHEARDTLSQAGDTIPEIMVMRELPKPRETHLLIRGAYDSPGEVVNRQTPAKLLPREFDGTPSRDDLVDWLVDPQHPLTARVAVNRFWQAIFGVGLVSTSEDFGLQGSLPANAELLDWLAAEFIDSGWDVKQLVKTIVTSETYQQSSDPTDQLLKVDPENRLLARGPASRLSAEMLRDAALATSGLLVEKMGGPPCKPYQPAGLWKEKSGKVYQRDEGEGSHRRSLYTYWKRTSPPPSMMTLDASNREVCVVKRQVTMTPLQVLVLLNDPQFVEAAKALAERAMTKNESSEARLEFVFHSLTGRKPTTDEVAILLDTLQSQLDYFKEDEQRAVSLLAIGDHKVAEELDTIGLAALTVVTEGLLSYDETVMKR